MFPLALAAALALPVSGDDAMKEAVKKDLKELEGTWETIIHVKDGTKRENPQGSNVRMILRGSFFKLMWGDREMGRGKLVVDPAANPKALDFLPAEQVVPIPEWQAAGRPSIYELKGDELRICFAAAGQPRPSGFAAELDKRLTLFVSRRVKP
jgi:uncharacterized protein (TIGR03067 family)